ncbi:MAG: cysteine--tRNA ligase [Patescibacteria group bacterium]|jgi:cysteinyl-tRNA synthetase
MEIKLYNTLIRKIEEFKPIHDKEVGIYSCGPTVYWNQHIGHMYAYVQWDSLVRFLRYMGYQVKWVMNITDVGHMTSDEDVGEDKMEKGAQREGISVWEVAQKYYDQFLESLKLLNITKPDVLSRATDHIQEQIDLIKRIEAQGFTYKTKIGLVFDTSKFPAYAEFACLNLKDQMAGARVEVDPEKRQPCDFLLWVTNQPKHQMQWDSPWGRGFPGWHIECTAMSTKYLGEKFDIHTGGKEHIPVHHTNEIAQAFGAFGTQTANYWLHNEWLTVYNQKMGKSLGNSILVTDLINKDFNPLALRYLILTSHYRKGLNFTWESLAAAQTALNRLYEIAREASSSFAEATEDKKVSDWKRKFSEAIADDLGMPQALSLVWEMVKSDLPDRDKYVLLLDWDKVLGLDIERNAVMQREAEIPDEVLKLAEEREQKRKEKLFAEADALRKKIEEAGFTIEDTSAGPKLKKTA